LTHPCFSGMKPTWSWYMIFCMWCCDCFVNILLRTFTPMFIRDIGAQFSFVVVSYSTFGSRLMMAMEKEFWRIPSLSILRKIVVDSSLKCFLKFRVTPSSPGVFFIWRYYVTDWILLFIIDIIRFLSLMFQFCDFMCPEMCLCLLDFSICWHIVFQNNP
jgi:hypothetical protein